MKYHIILVALVIFFFNSCKENVDNVTTNSVRLSEVNQDVIHNDEVIKPLIKHFPSNSQQDATSNNQEKNQSISSSENFEVDSQVKNAKEIIDEKPFVNKQAENKLIGKIKKSTNQKKTIDNESQGELYFPQLEYDFGFINQGEVIDYTFKFRNIGTKAVNISNVSASCGCTTPVYPFIPIEPNDAGQIQVRFNSKGRLGSQTATVTVYSDAKNESIELYLSGVVRAEISEFEPSDSIK